MIPFHDQTIHFRSIRLVLRRNSLQPTVRRPDCFFHEASGLPVLFRFRSHRLSSRGHRLGQPFLWFLLFFLLQDFRLSFPAPYLPCVLTLSPLLPVSFYPLRFEW